jgi:oligoribonuclease (3'-5' exoribonuclease)
MDSIVALDIETTGLDPAKDAIIDIGAVRFTTTAGLKMNGPPSSTQDAESRPSSHN